MTLKEKFSDVQEAYHDRSDDCVRVADDFAIGFAEWIYFIRVLDNGVYSLNSYEELLEIYKKENKL